MTQTYIDSSDIETLSKKVELDARCAHYQTLILKHEISNDYYEFAKTADKVPPGPDWQRNTHVGNNGFFKQWHWYRRKK